MVDEHGVQLEPAEQLWYVRVPTNKYRGEFWLPIPQYTAEAILAWKALRPKNQPLVPDRKTRQPTAYLFQYREKLVGSEFLNNSLIPLLCKAAGLIGEQGTPYRDASRADYIPSGPRFHGLLSQGYGHDSLCYWQTAGTYQSKPDLTLVSERKSPSMRAYVPESQSP